MAETTNLKLFKHDNPSTNDAEFDIDNALNENWDIIDETFGTANNVIKDLQINVEDLNSENDKQNEDIETLKTDNDTNKENIETNASNIEKNTKDIELNTENIQTNTEDINTLKTQKEELEKEVQSLKEDAKLNSLTEDNEGELVHIDNSTGARFNSLEIEGNEKQETREGYNLYNVKNLEKVPGQTVDEDDFITLEKTVAQSIDSYMNAHLKVSSALKANTNYWLVIEVKEFSGISKFILNQYLVESKTQIRTDVSLIEANQKAGTYKYKVTTSEDFTGMAYCLRTFAKFNADTTGKIVFRMSLLEQEPDLDTFKYQKYGTMPSFDYPSEIEAVGDNINLFDKNSITADKYINGNLTNTTNAYGALVNSTATNTSDFMPVIKDQNYVFHFEYENLVSTNTRGYCFYNKEKQLIESNADTTYNPANKEFQVTAKKDGYIRISYDKNCTNIKFEQGEKATAYSEYGQGCVALNITDKNILDTNSINSTLSGVKFESNLDGSLNISGTPTKSFISLRANFKLDYPIKSGTKISCLFGKTADLQKDSELTPYVWTSDENNNSGGNINPSDGYSLIVKRDITKITYGIEGFITSNNYNTKLYLMLVVGDIAQSKYIQYQKQTYVIPVQQRMFKQDKFIKINGVWKEMHTMGTVYSKDVSNIVVSGNAVSGVDGFYRYNVNLGVSNRKGGSYIRLYSNYFKYGDSRWNNKEGICGWENGQSFSLGTYNKNYDTADKLKKFLTENNVEFDYELAKPIYLDCTPEQIEVLDKIEQEAHTYSEVTNVYTEDEVGAVLKTNTAVDLKSVINNIQEQLIAE